MSGSLQGAVEFLAVREDAFGLLQAHGTRRDQPRKRLGHGGHAQLSAGLDVRVDLVRLVVTNERADSRRRQHDLRRERASVPTSRGQELLAEDRLEREREHRPHLILLIRREDVDDAVHRLDRVGRVERAEGEVAGLGERERGLDGLVVPEFPHQNDVGILTQHALEGVLEAARVIANLSLGDHAPLVLVHELDGVLDRDDVVAPRLVDVIDHRGERGRLAGAGDPCEEHEP